ncbi:sialate O-acetylesterase [Priestia megaterium]|uniref:sialate O-acetylesterase n=1 Tax=Priestia megaterium TaxID=1404 RepID=UPI0023DB0B25|nr:sialate O-acetylesterase [Priestia megaterium]MDF1962504.1 sialate O-acetylesterase [Priestia megaterium]
MRYRLPNNAWDVGFEEDYIKNLKDIDTEFTSIVSRIANLILAASSGEIQANDARLDLLNVLHSTLKDRLDSDAMKVLGKADLSYVETILATAVSGAPKGVYTTLTALKTAYPQGTEGVFLVLENGHIYIWNATAWTDAGVYQGIEIPKNSVTTDKIANRSVNESKVSSDLRYTFKDLSKIADDILTKGTVIPSGALTTFFDVFSSMSTSGGTLTAVKKTSPVNIVGGGLFSADATELSFKGLNGTTYIVVAYDGTYAYHIQISGTTLTLRKHDAAQTYGTIKSYTLAASVASTSTVKIVLDVLTIDIYVDGTKILSIANDSITAPYFVNRRLGFLQTPTGDFSNINSITINSTTTKVSSIQTDISGIRSDISGLRDSTSAQSQKVLVNSDIGVNTADFTIINDVGEVKTSLNPNTYKWLMFNSSISEIEFTMTAIDTWIVLYGNANNALAFLPRNGALYAGHLRNFSKTGRTDLTNGNSSRYSVVSGDTVKITQTGNIYTMTVRKLGQLTFTDWFTLDLTPYIDDTMSHGFGFLTGTQTDVAVATNPIGVGLFPLKDSFASLKKEFDDYVSSPSNIADSKTIDLIMFMGQSNMAGRGTAADSPVVPIGSGYEFRAITDPTKLYNIVEPFGVNENISTGINEPGMKTGSMVSSFVIEYNKLTKRPVIGVSASKGGSSINEWQPGTAYLNDAINRFNTAKTWLTNNGYTIKNKFMVWCQGETDGDNAMSKADYTTKIKAMIEEMIAQGIEKCYLVRIGNHRDNSTIYDNIMAAQTELAKTYKNVVLVSTKFASMAADGLMKDQFHYVQQGYNITGAEAGINTAFHIMNKKEPFMFDSENNNLYFSQK